MFNYDLPRDQDRIQFRIGINTHLSEVSRNFFISGKAILHLPKLTMGRFCETLTCPVELRPGGRVPLIHWWTDHVHFGDAIWGERLKGCDKSILLRRAEVRSLGMPALIPASRVDLLLGSDVLRIRPKAIGDHLYVGCRYTADRMGAAQTVTPLICEAGPDIARYTDWQPLIIRVWPVPNPKNFEFLRRQDMGRLQVPSAPETLSAEIVALT